MSNASIIHSVYTHTHTPIRVRRVKSFSRTYMSTAASKCRYTNECRYFTHSQKLTFSLHFTVWNSGIYCVSSFWIIHAMYLTYFSVSTKIFYPSLILSVLVCYYFLFATTTIIFYRMQFRRNNQQSAMMKTDAGTCASLSVSLLTTSSRLSNHFLLYTPIDLRFQSYQQSNQTSHSDQPKIYPTVFLNTATELTSTT